MRPEGVLRKDTFDWIVSADIVLPRDAKLNVQAFQRLYSGGESTLAVQSGSFGVSAMISGKVTPTSNRSSCGSRPSAAAAA